MKQKDEEVERIFTILGGLAIEYFQRRLQGQRPQLRVDLNWEDDDVWTTADAATKGSRIPDQGTEPYDESGDW